jgi:hypothetical protein
MCFEYTSFEYTSILVFIFLRVCFFQTSEKWTPVDPDKISEETYPNL